MKILVSVKRVVDFNVRIQVLARTATPKVSNATEK